MAKKLDNGTYEREIQRMSHLRGFPHVPRAQLDLRRAMRRITDCDSVFLHRLIGEILAAGDTCPTPHELQERASGMRRRSTSGGGGRVDCPECHGTGYVHRTRMVNPPSLPPYEADVSERCRCTSVKGAA